MALIDDILEISWLIWSLTLWNNILRWLWFDPDPERLLRALRGYLLLVLQIHRPRQFHRLHISVLNKECFKFQKLVSK